MKNSIDFYQFARNFATLTNRNIFLTGKAGTGKTTFLHQLKSQTRKQMAIVAPTGVAAINAGGTTIHSFFQLPFSPFFPTPQGRKDLVEKIKMQGQRRKVLQELELLVIDEVSMVRADVLDALDTVLRHFRFRNNEPFGGVQVILIGDMYQLSPVTVDDEWRFLSEHYSSPYFFHSRVILQQTPVYIEFDHIFRQSDPQFITLLNEVRNNQLSIEGLKLLQGRYQPSFIPSSESGFITLTTHNYKADRINEKELKALKTHEWTFEAKIVGDFPEKSFPAEKELLLKEGAKVMFIKNDTHAEKRFYNGKTGIVEELDEDVILVRCHGEEEPIEVTRMEWENIRYSVHPTTQQLEEKKIGTFEQFPLRLAWAITIHKSQGLTFDKVVIDAGDAFAPGQVYVALSRCRSLEGIVLTSKIQSESIENDKLIVEHSQTKVPLEILENELQSSRNEFRAYIAGQLFDYRLCHGLANRLLKETTDTASSFSSETIPFLQAVKKSAEELDTVSEKFRHQISRIFIQQPFDEKYLTERLSAAQDFFRTKTEELLEMLKQSPATTDSRENAKLYNDQINVLFGLLRVKQHILSGLKFPFEVENYFELKNSCFVPSSGINAYSKLQHEKTGVKNPALFRQLVELRNQICEPQDLPVYLVAGNKTISEMAAYLPQNEAELLLIDGFGPVKIKKYGELFLSIIRKYCHEKGLASAIAEKEPKKKSKEKPAQEKPEKTATEKKEKGETYRITYQLYKQGKSLTDIAAERQLTVGTIATHLTRYVKAGMLPISDFISEKKLREAKDLVDNRPENQTLTQTLEGVLTETERAFFFFWNRNQQEDEPKE